MRRANGGARDGDGTAANGGGQYGNAARRGRRPAWAMAAAAYAQYGGMHDGNNMLRQTRLRHARRAAANGGYGNMLARHAALAAAARRRLPAYDTACNNQ